MSVFKQLAKVKAAQQRTLLARQTLRPPVTALLARGQTYPLGTVGAAAGAGFVLGHFNVHPLRVPGLGPLLSGGLADTVAFGARLIAELGMVGASAGRDAAATAASGRSDGDPASANDEPT
jgi:hypothetical protein